MDLIAIKPYFFNIGTDQPVNLHIMISTYIKRYLVTKAKPFYFQNFDIVGSLCSQAGWYEPC